MLERLDGLLNGWMEDGLLGAIPLHGMHGVYREKLILAEGS